MKQFLAIAACAACIMGAFLLLARKTSPLTVWVFSIGQGDAIFIDGPEKQVLIDGGPSVDVLEKLGAVLPPWDRALDAVVLTHPHADHVFGLNAVLERYRVAEVFSTLAPYSEPPAVAFVTHEPKGIAAGDRIDLGGGAVLEVVWPPTTLAGEYTEDPNDGSVVMKLTYGGTTMVFTGDAGVAEEEHFAPMLGDVDVLKVGHHGSDTSTGGVLLNLTQPEVAVISVGEGNSYAHPSPIVVDRLENAGVAVYRTDVVGDMRIRSHGEEPDVAVFDL